MPAEPSPVVSVTRDSAFQISYELEDGTSSAFRVMPAMGDLIEQWWCERPEVKPRSLRTLRDLFSYWTATEANKIRELLFAHMDEQAADIERLKAKVVDPAEAQQQLADLREKDKARDATYELLSKACSSYKKQLAALRATGEQTLVERLEVAMAVLHSEIGYIGEWYKHDALKTAEARFAALRAGDSDA